MVLLLLRLAVKDRVSIFLVALGLDEKTRRVSLLIHVFLELSDIVHVLVVEEVLILVLLVVVIRRFVLVDIEILHLFPSLFFFQISLSLS